MRWSFWSDSGDAPWDVEASGLLGLPLIGIGRRAGVLRDLGVRHTFRDYSDADSILAALREFFFEGRPG